MSNLFAINSVVVFVTLILLIILSIVTWSIALFKTWKQFQAKKLDKKFIERFWAAREWAEAQKVAQEGQGDFARLAQAGFAEIKTLGEVQQDLKHMGKPHDVLERQLVQQLQNIQRRHERGQAELATIGSTSPFVGLFGTVWGIMHALQDIGKSGSASLDVVAGPIGEALIATAIGIAVALPAVLFYNFFLRRLKVHVTDLENFAHDFMRLAQKHDYKVCLESGVLNPLNVDREVEPKVEVEIPMEKMTVRPRSIVVAVYSIGVSTVIGLVSLFLSFANQQSGMNGLSKLLIFFVIPVYAFTIFMVYKIYEGKNWARFFFLIGCILALVAMPNYIKNEFTQSIFLGVLFVLQWVLNLYSLFLLYSKSGGEWFKRYVGKQTVIKST